MATATAKLYVPAQSVREVEVVPGETLSQFLARNHIDVTQFTIILNGERVAPDKVAETPVATGDRVTPVRAVRNG